MSEWGISEWGISEWGIRMRNKWVRNKWVRNKWVRNKWVNLTLNKYEHIERVKIWCGIGLATWLRYSTIIIWWTRIIPEYGVPDNSKVEEDDCQTDGTVYNFRRI